jgi:hypothetical protein
MDAPDGPGRGLLGGLRQVTTAVREVARWSRPPPLPVAVTCPAPGAGVDRSAVPARAAAAVGATVRGRLRELGVPGRPAVTVTVADTDTITVAVHQRPCRLRAPRLAAALAAVEGYDGSLEGLDEPAWLGALQAACHVGIECDPSVLVGPGQREAMLATARAAGVASPDDDALAAVMEQLVANGVSLGAPASLAKALATTEPCNTAAELAEVAIDRLRPRASAVLVPEATLRRATAAGFDPAAFVNLRIRLFSILGVHFPDLTVAPAPGQPEGTCALRLNAVTTHPVRLPDGADVDALAELVEARFREHASWFVAMSDVQRVVRELRLAVPELVNTVRDQHSWPQLSAMARTLVEESVPVRNAARLLGLLLDAPAPGRGHDLVRLAEPHRRGVGDRGDPPTPRQLVAWARQQNAEEQARAMSGLRELAVERLPADLEAELERPGRPPGAAAAARLRGVAERFAGSGDSIVVSTQQARATARDLLARQYPEVPVKASEEFPPWWRLTTGPDRAS